MLGKVELRGEEDGRMIRGGHCATSEKGGRSGWEESLSDPSLLPGLLSLCSSPSPMRPLCTVDPGQSPPGAPQGSQDKLSAPGLSPAGLGLDTIPATSFTLIFSSL